MRARLFGMLTLDMLLQGTSGWAWAPKPPSTIAHWGMGADGQVRRTPDVRIRPRGLITVDEAKAKLGVLERDVP